MKISEEIKKNATPTFFDGGYRFKFHIGDINERILKVHVEYDKKYKGTMFLEKRGKRILRPDDKKLINFKKLSEVKKILSEKEMRNDIEKRWGKELETDHVFDNSKIEINGTKLTFKYENQIRKVDLKRVDDFKSFRDWDELEKLEIEIDYSGLNFLLSKREANLVPWSEILFHD